MRIAIFTDTFHPDINGFARTLTHFTEYLDTQNISYKVFAPISSTNEYVSSKLSALKAFLSSYILNVVSPLPTFFELNQN